MQPPTPAPAPPEEETKVKVSDINNEPGSGSAIKKRRVSIKKKKVIPDAVMVDHVIVATPSVSLSDTRSPGPYRGKCLYQSRKCENERAIKRNGKPHNLCEEHRFKQNQHQRKFDAKKFSRKRRRGSVSDEDAKVDDDEQQSHRNEEPSAKHHRTMTHQEAETMTPIHVITPNAYPPTPMEPTMRGEHNYGAGSMPMAAPLTRLPPIQSPRGPILSPSPAVVSHPSSMRLGLSSEVYSRGHVAFSDYRPEAGQLIHSGQQPPHLGHRPYILQQVPQNPTGYSHSELVAASTLVQPQQYPSHTTPVYRKNDVHTPTDTSNETTGEARTESRVLPSLLVHPSAALSPSPYNRLVGFVPSRSQRFAPVIVSPPSSVYVSPARSVGNVLPPLVSFGLRRSTQSLAKPPSK